MGLLSEVGVLPVFILLAIFSVPLAAIVSRTYIKAKELESRGSPALAGEMKLLRGQVAELQQRVEVLETIAVNSSDSPSPAVRELEELQRAASRSR